MSTTNPSTPSDVAVAKPSEINPTPETVRRAHLYQEASLQALGILFSLIGVVVLIATIFALSTTGNRGLEIRPGIWGVVDVTAYTVGIVSTLTVGYSVGHLRRWTRIPAIVLCSIFVLRIGDGTLIFGYFLYVLLSAKGRRVFAADYPSILATTSQIKYPRSTVVWTVVAALIVEVALRALRVAVRGSAF
jgi:hypothetical protein